MDDEAPQKSDRPTFGFLLHSAVKVPPQEIPLITGNQQQKALPKRVNAYEGAYRETAS
jgi:hypothetical protein